MSRKISLGFAITLMAIIAAVVFSITTVFSMQIFNSRVASIAEREKMYEKLAEIDHIVRQNYYGAIDEDILNDYIAQGYIAGLQDPYSAYYSVDAYLELTENYSGSMAGIGARVRKGEFNFIEIIEVYEGSPAEAVGLMDGDLIIKVEDLDINSEETYVEATEMIRGDAGAKVNLTYRRGIEDTEVEITLRQIEVPTVYYTFMETNGYIKITDFNENTAEQFSAAVDTLLANSDITGLIFDVRENQGGLLDSVVAMLDKLIEEDQVLVKANYLDGTSRQRKTESESSVDMPMVVLMNDKTASAAELFAIALMDHDKAKSVGITTYGKGVMQELRRLNDGSAISITVASYDPPKSANYNGIGITPDIKVEPTNREMYDLPFWQINEFSDNQLKRAIDTIEQTKRELGIQSGSQTPDEDFLGPEEDLPEDGDPLDGDEVDPDGEDGDSTGTEDDGGDDSSGDDDDDDDEDE